MVAYLRPYPNPVSNLFINLQIIDNLHIYNFNGFGIIHLLSHVRYIFVKSLSSMFAEFGLSPYFHKSISKHSSKYSPNSSYLIITNIHGWSIYLRILSIFVFESSSYFDISTDHNLSPYNDRINHRINIISIFSIIHK